MDFYRYEEFDGEPHGLLCADCLAKNKHSFDRRWVLIEEPDTNKKCDCCDEYVFNLIHKHENKI